MQRYQLVNAFVHAAIAGLLYLFLRFVAEIDKYPYADYIRGAAILVLPFLFNQSGVIANLLIEKIPLVSRAIRRTLSGKDFIEGDWPLVVMQEDRRTLKYLGFLTIAYEGGQLVVSGDDWHPDGSDAVTFRSQQAKFEGRLLQYWYAQGATEFSKTQFGYTRIHFFPAQGQVQRHAGEFLDKEHKSPPFFARRLRYTTFQRRLETKEQKLETARQFWGELEGKLKAMPEVRIDRDFG